MASFKRLGAWMVLFIETRGLGVWASPTSMGSQVTSILVHLFLSHLPPRLPPRPYSLYRWTVESDVLPEASVLWVIIGHLFCCCHLLTTVEWQDCKLGALWLEGHPTPLRLFGLCTVLARSRTPQSLQGQHLPWAREEEGQTPQLLRMSRLLACLIEETKSLKLSQGT